MRTHFRGRPERRHHHPDAPHGGIHRGRGRGGRRHGGRMPRGDVRTAVLLLLADEPMHGYQLMQSVAERTGGQWRPSPGAVYPTINQLEDEGLVTVTADAGRKLVTLTDAGREHVAALDNVDPFASFAGEERGVDLHEAVRQVHEAARQIARTGTEDQVAAAARILAEARKSLYLLLADGPAES